MLAYNVAFTTETLYFYWLHLGVELLKGK